MGLEDQGPLDIAVIGTGISGMASAWLLSRRHRVTVYEEAPRLGGHTNTVDAVMDGVRHPVDTGFIVYNEPCYPNLTALFKHLDVPTKASVMSFAVSLDDGKLEYAGSSLNTLFAQRRNLFDRRFWSMIRDLLRFYKEAPSLVDSAGSISLGAYLTRQRYGAAFRDDHLLPMVAAIWSAPAKTLLDYPAEAFVRFCENHGLLKISDRPQWRTVVGGSRAYVARLTARYADRIRLSCGARRIVRTDRGVDVTDASGQTLGFDHIVIAAHADQALAMLGDPSPAEADLLGAFRYERNLAYLHSDPSLMPKRRAVWSSWNYLGRRGPAIENRLCVTYWMNELQSFAAAKPLFVTLNPEQPPRPETIFHEEAYDHPIFTCDALAAQRKLWSLQGQRGTWYCGAYFGAGFHEDGLQAGLAVAEALGGVRRPWTVEGESARITLGGVREPALAGAAE